MVKCGGLLAVVLENVCGIMTSFGGYESAGSKFLRVLQKWVPEFTFKIDVVHLTEYVCAQNRIRVFLRGVRRSIAESVPPVLPSFGKRDLRESLAVGWPRWARNTRKRSVRAGT